MSGLPRPEPLFTFLYDDGAGRTWWSAVYEVRCELPVGPQAEEVAWHAFLHRGGAGATADGVGVGAGRRWRRTSA